MPSRNGNSVSYLISRLTGLGDTKIAGPATIAERGLEPARSNDRWPQVAPHCQFEIPEALWSSCAVAELVEYCRDLGIHFVFSIQIDDPLPQSINVDVIAVGVNAPLHVMLAGCAGLPDDFEPHLTSDPLLIKNEFADDESQNALAIGHRGSLQIPPGEVSQIPPPARQDRAIAESW